VSGCDLGAMLCMMLCTLISDLNIERYRLIFMSERTVLLTFVDSDVFAAKVCSLNTVTLRKLYSTKILVTTAVVVHKCYNAGMRHERFQKIKKRYITSTKFSTKFSRRIITILCDQGNSNKSAL
jgi:hypothetical protein